MIVRDNSGMLHIEVALSIGRRWGNGVGAVLAVALTVLETLDVCDSLYPMIWSKLYNKGGADALYVAICARPGLFS